MCVCVWCLKGEKKKHQHLQRVPFLVCVKAEESMSLDDRQTKIESYWLVIISHQKRNTVRFRRISSSNIGMKPLLYPNLFSSSCAHEGYSPKIMRQQQTCTTQEGHDTNGESTMIMRSFSTSGVSTQLLRGDHEMSSWNFSRS